MVQTTLLSCMGLGLYDWKDDREFTQWLTSHPIFSTNEAMHVNYIDGFATLQNNEADIKLATWIDNIKLKDVVEMNFDNIKVHELNDLIEEGNLIPPLEFKQTFSGLMIENDVAIYLQIPNDCYRKSIEKTHFLDLDYKLMDLTLKNEDLKLIKVGF